MVVKTAYYEYDIEKMDESYLLKIKRIMKNHFVGEERVIMCSPNMLELILDGLGFPQDLIKKLVV